jgi:hypothetical protein
MERQGLNVGLRNKKVGCELKDVLKGKRRRGRVASPGAGRHPCSPHVKAQREIRE